MTRVVEIVDRLRRHADFEHDGDMLADLNQLRLLLIEQQQETSTLRGQVNVLQVEAAARPQLGEAVAWVLSNTAVMREVRNMAIVMSCDLDTAAKMIARIATSRQEQQRVRWEERQLVHAEISRRMAGLYEYAIAHDHPASIEWAAAADLAAETVCPTCRLVVNDQCKRSWHRALTPNEGTTDVQPHPETAAHL